MRRRATSRRSPPTSRWSARTASRVAAHARYLSTSWRNDAAVLVAANQVAEPLRRPPRGSTPPRRSASRPCAGAPAPAPARSSSGGTPRWRRRSSGSPRSSRATGEPAGPPAGCLRWTRRPRLCCAGSAPSSRWWRPLCAGGACRSRSSDSAACSTCPRWPNCAPRSRCWRTRPGGTRSCGSSPGRPSGSARVTSRRSTSGHRSCCAAGAAGRRRRNLQGDRAPAVPGRGAGRTAAARLGGSRRPAALRCRQEQARAPGGDTARPAGPGGSGAAGPRRRGRARAAPRRRGDRPPRRAARDGARPPRRVRRGRGGFLRGRARRHPRRLPRLARRGRRAGARAGRAAGAGPAGRRPGAHRARREGSGVGRRRRPRARRGHLPHRQRALAGLRVERMAERSVRRLAVSPARGRGAACRTGPPEAARSQADLAGSFDAFKILAREHEIAEERRLAYVAATRARAVLALSGSVWGDGATPREPSRFLVEVGELRSGIRQWTGAGRRPRRHLGGAARGRGVEPARPRPAAHRGRSTRSATARERRGGGGGDGPRLPRGHGAADGRARRRRRVGRRRRRPDRRRLGRGGGPAARRAGGRRARSRPGRAAGAPVGVQGGRPRRRPRGVRRPAPPAAAAAAAAAGPPRQRLPRLAGAAVRGRRARRPGGAARRGRRRRGRRRTSRRCRRGSSRASGPG